MHAITASRLCISIGDAGSDQWDEGYPETIALMVAALRMNASQLARGERAEEWRVASALVIRLLSESETPL